MAAAPTGFLIAPEMLAFARGHYELKRDLEALARVQQARAAEAVAFYAGRVLEVLAAQALEDLGLEAHGTVLANLDVLEQYSLMPVQTRYAGHGLRRLANDARHILRPIGAGDALLAGAFVEHWMVWYFCGFAFGPKLAAIAEPGAKEGLRGLLASFQDMAREQALSEAITQATAFLRGDGGKSGSPALVAILVEALLNVGRMEVAQGMLAQGLAAFPEDLRLRLLQGLYWSRTGELERALGILEPIFGRYKNDPEAAGILAGVYKRMWQREGDAKGAVWLQRSFETYHTGWKASRETSEYLGTNTATTALWLGRSEVSAALATGIRTMVAGRMERLATRMPDPLAAMEYWAGVTVAELELLAGDVARLRQTYGRLFALHAEKAGSIDVTRRQAGLILRALGKDQGI